MRPEVYRVYGCLVASLAAVLAVTCPGQLTVRQQGQAKKSVTLGFLGAYGNTHVGLGALPLAVDTINRDPTLLPGVELKYVAADIGTENKSYASCAIQKMTEMRDNDSIAFIGPDDTCISEALVAAAWNLPMIAYKCADTKVSDKSVYSTFARTLPPSSKVSKSVVALLKAFQWDRFSLVWCKTRAWVGEVREAIMALASNQNMIVTEQRSYSDYIPRLFKHMDDIVLQTYKTTRVYVFLGEHIALVDFVKSLHQRHLLDTGEYIVISVDDEIYDPDHENNIYYRPYIDPYLQSGRGQLSDMERAFRSVLKLSSSHPRNPNYQSICRKIRNLSKEGFSVPYHDRISGNISVPIHSMYLYDAVMIYARALTEVLQDGLNPKDGEAILNRIVNRSYQSVLGFDVFIDGNGDAEGNYSVITLMEDASADGIKMSMQPVAYFLNNASASSDPFELPDLRYYNESRPIPWVSGAPPRAEPLCGFGGEKCVRQTDWRIVVTMVLVVSLLLVGVGTAIKHYRYEQKLACLLWKIDSKELTFIPIGVAETSYNTKNMVRNGRCPHAASLAPDPTELAPKRAFTTIALYKGNVVAVKTIHKKNVDLTRSIRKELKEIREMRHENVMPFIGACVDSNNVSIVTPYCTRGSLQDVLANKDLHLDQMFISSLVADLLKGMIYLHDSDIFAHGNLKSTNCLIDSRWVLQIADCGLHEFKEIIDRVRHYEGDRPFRPMTEHLVADKCVVRCMLNCWDEDPEQRPDIRFVRVKLKELQAGLKPNIFDNMLAIMEKYASNLEALVSERTDQLTEEKKKTEALLHRMLPKTVAEALKRGDPVEAETFDCVTIYFSDIVGFTELSATSTPLQVVDLLNDLYTCCDSIISHYDVYKVETIGDAYMVVSGLPIRNDDRHAGEIASMAIHMLSKVRRFEIKHRRGEPITLRIGIHSGHCVAGVVGLKMPRYCLFGDTVNTASRMESTGEAFKIHISEATKKLLDRIGGYCCVERGLTPIKGKGEMMTYWLTGEDMAKRMARIRQDMFTASLGSLGSSHLSETPDLLRRPVGDVFLDGTEDGFATPDTNYTLSGDLCQLHLRALRSFYTRLPQEPVDSTTVSCNNMFRPAAMGLDPRRLVRPRLGTRDNQSAPAVSFTMESHIL